MRYYEDYIEHAFLDSARKKISEALSGRIKPHHKYYQRVSLGKDRKGKNKYRYFYTKAEFDAYNKTKANSKTAGSFLNSGKNAVEGYYSILLDDYTLRNIRHQKYLDIDTGGFLEHLLGISLISVRKERSDFFNNDNNTDTDTDTDDRRKDTPDLTDPNEQSKSLDYIKAHHPKDPPKYIAKVRTDHGYRYFYDRGEYERYLDRNQPTKLSELDRLNSSDSSFDAVTRNIKEINPNYKSSKNWQTNCGDCSLAYEMRRRGYNVMADDHDDDYYDWAQNGNTTSVFPDAKSDYYDLTRASDYDAATAKLCNDMKKNYPDGARGVMSIAWGSGSGHMIAWEMHNDEPYFIDAQTGSVMTEREFSQRYMRNINYKVSDPATRWVDSKDPVSLMKSYNAAKGKSTAIMTTRLDNCTIKDTAASQVLPNSKNQNENHELESEAKANDPNNYKDPKPGHYSDDNLTYIDSNGNTWRIGKYTTEEYTNQYGYRHYHVDERYLWTNINTGEDYDPSGYYEKNIAKVRE